MFFVTLRLNWVLQYIWLGTECTLETVLEFNYFSKINKTNLEIA